ncbi:SDR family oxidoreductase [Halorubellus salinus]|uniref:SDR family oxidoreductase n=1 Tax=Halorubellus salinus TaxID=755309 RepID=UPI001D084F6A|nr:SDR family oxidoreductase [Halorubellus salinus]
MAELLAEKVAVVTGASSGIGRAIALGFANHGASVVVADLREEPRGEGGPTHELIRDRGGTAEYVECDVTDVADLAVAVEAATTLGGIDVMVNNAGIGESTPVLEVTEADFERTMAVNAKGVFFGSQVAAREMVADGGGSIVNLSSEAGIVGVGGFVPYSASKGAVRVMSYALADALGGDGIRVNAIHPGIIETAMTTEDVPQVGTARDDQYLASIPLARFGQPSDVADAAVFLASDMSRYVTATSLVVDGGMLNTA